MRKFFLGLHQLHHAKYFNYVFISVNRLRRRKSYFLVKSWIMDCAGFTELKLYGRYRHSVAEYACEIRYWKGCGNLIAAVSQDYMCEPFMLRITGLTVLEHQQLTIERYDALIAEDTGVYIIPVLQGYTPEEYVQHVDMYGDRLTPGMWVGVGSVCKRNADPELVYEVLKAIKKRRPDLRLHGFGLKTTALDDRRVRDLLETSDSMAWSYNARMNGRDANHWMSAKNWMVKLNLEELDA